MYPQGVFRADIAFIAVFKTKHQGIENIGHFINNSHRETWHPSIQTTVDTRQYFHRYTHSTKAADSSY